MNPREINDPLPGLGPKIEPTKPPEPKPLDKRSPTNPQVRIAPDGKVYTDIPENSRAKWETDKALREWAKCNSVDLGAS